MFIAILYLTFAVKVTRLQLFFVAMITRMCQKCFCLFKIYLNRKCGIVHLNEHLVGKIYSVHIRALISLYQTTPTNALIYY